MPKYPVSSSNGMMVTDAMVSTYSVVPYVTRGEEKYTDMAACPP